MSQITEISKIRPARIQVSPEELNEEELPPQTGTVFNIWFNKWSGGAPNTQLIKAKNKLNVSKDTGYTKADKSGQKYFCLYFAKGVCCKGSKCQYLHRIPNEFDIFPSTVDCFGREKFSEYRDDMSGIGSFNHVNKTLYIGSLVIKSNTLSLLNEEFRKLGKINKINIINDKNCGFVEFKNQSNAQFAKEAMNCQSLFGEDILNIKWANDDPNPEVQKQKKRELELETEQVVKGLLEKYDQKKQKIEPEIEQEIEEDDEEEVKNEIKQIEAPKTDKTNNILSNKNLNYLSLLKKKPQQPKQLISGYDSDSDSD